MKQEIIFRGRRIDNGEYCDGDLICAVDGTFIRQQYNYNIFEKPILCRVDEGTISQYTNKTDSKGEKIFRLLNDHSPKNYYRWVHSCDRLPKVDEDSYESSKVIILKNSDIFVGYLKWCGCFGMRWIINGMQYTTDGTSWICLKY